MRIAIPCWQNCISPVFDVSENLLLADIVDNQVTRLTSTGFNSVSPFARATKLADLKVDVLICGAISQTLAMAVAGQSIKIVSFVFGPWQDILTFYIHGELENGGDDRSTVACPGRHRKRCRKRD